jgi:AmmeMemoRadiSam system protein A
MHLSEDQRTRLLDIARQTIRHELSDATGPAPATLNELLNDPSLQDPAGCFVSLHELGTQRLRGCVGCIDGKDPLARAVQQGASAVLHDPRFHDHRVRFDELANLELEITVLSPLQDAADALDFDPLEHGIYLTVAGESGCFLPQVARETGWSREQLLDRLSYEKLGMTRDAWRSPDAKLQRFTTTIVGPEPFMVPAAQRWK